ncbi:MAG: polysaccharide export protein [Phycisphaerae bacterium]|nr:polysaccharide export protein [Phycisphaerae bacterium]
MARPAAAWGLLAERLEITGMTGKEKSALDTKWMRTLRSSEFVVRRSMWSGVLGTRALCAVGAVVGMAATGCTPSDQEINSFIHAWEASVSSPDYRMQPPDELVISSPTAPELDGQSQVIRQDGKISLNLVGEVKVTGMTPVEIGRKLEALLRKYYLDPHVSVRAAGRGSKRFYVFGHVSQSGAFPYTGRDTLLGVLATAQPTFVAWKSQIKVIHPSHEEGERRVLTIDADRIMTEGKLDQNVLLEEGDIIYVPPSPLAWVALRLREIMWPFTSAAEEIEGPQEAGTSVESTANYFAGRK